MGIRICFIVFLFYCFVGNSVAYNGFSGWWFVEGRGGTGVSVEMQGENTFVAIFDFNDFSPFWISSFGKVQEMLIERGKPAGLFYMGNVYLFNGWPLGTSYVQPKTWVIGDMLIEFLSASEANLEYVISKEFTTSGEEESVKVHLVKFMPTLFKGSSDSRDVNGWWYDHAFNGMGFFTEAYGDTIFMAWYHYAENNGPTWLSCYAPFTPEDNQFTCTMQQWQGGSTMGASNYIAPRPQNLEDAVFKLTGEGRAELTWKGTTYHLERFIFSK